MNRPVLPYPSRLILSGADTIPFLERIITCRVDDMQIGEERPGALLTPQGKVIADFQLTRTNTGCTLDMHEEAAPLLEKRLKLFRLRSDVTIDQHHQADVSIDDMDRIHAGLPAFGSDFGEADVFPTDINLDLRGGIDYKKGCFVGQEVVSRMKRRGKIRKRTVSILGADIPIGADIYADSKRLGIVTSSVGELALARIRTDYLATALAQNIELTVENEIVHINMQDWLQTEMAALMEAPS